MKKSFFMSIILMALAPFALAGGTIKIDAKKLKAGTVFRLQCIDQKQRNSVEEVAANCGRVGKVEFTEEQLNSTDARMHSGDMEVTRHAPAVQNFINCLLETGKINNGFTHQGSMNHCEVAQLGNNGASRLLLNQPLEQ